MCAQRRECRFANKDYKDVDLTQYSKIITDTIEKTVPGKNPVVEKNKFSTDMLSHKEAVKLGMALSSLSELEGYGKTVTIFRLFDGKIVDTDKKDNNKSNNTIKPKRKPLKKEKPKGGRMT